MSTFHLPSSDPTNLQREGVNLFLFLLLYNDSGKKKVGYYCYYTSPVTDTMWRLGD